MNELTRLLLALLLLSPLATLRAAEPVVPVGLPVPTPAQRAWQEAEFGVMFHYDPRVFHDGAPSLQAACRTPLKDPDAYAQKFNPAKLDTDQWIATAKAMGAKFAILVVKHETGFCLWPSDANPFCLKNIKWRDGKADLLRDFTASCRKFGLKPGIFTEARWDLRLGVHDFQVGAESPVTQAEYNRLVEREVEELCTRYGDFFEIWFDGGVRSPAQGGPDVLPIVEKHQPGIVFYHSDQRRDVRWGGTESGTVPYPCWAAVPVNAQHGDKYARQGDASGKRWQPAMSDAPLRCENKLKNWFWKTGGEKGVASLQHLQQMYYGSVGRNSTLIIGLTPDRDGLMPETDATRCAELGAWMEKTFGGKPLAETAGKGAELSLEIPASVKDPVTHIILQEDIKDGERVREYVVEAEVAGAWKQVGAGSCIGHKHIEMIEPCAARKYRLRVTKSTGDAEISTFNVR